MPVNVVTQLAPPLALYLQFFFESHPGARKWLNLLLRHARRHATKYSPDFVLSYVLNYSFKYSVAYLVKYVLGSMLKRTLEFRPRKVLPPKPDAETEQESGPEAVSQAEEWSFHDI